jgi:hypothetical protein
LVFSLKESSRKGYYFTAFARRSLGEVGIRLGSAGFERPPCKKAVFVVQFFGYAQRKK